MTVPPPATANDAAVNNFIATVRQVMTLRAGVQGSALYGWSACDQPFSMAHAYGPGAVRLPTFDENYNDMVAAVVSNVELTVAQSTAPYHGVCFARHGTIVCDAMGHVQPDRFAFKIWLW